MYLQQGHFDSDVPALARELQGIRQEVLDYLQEAARVAIHILEQVNVIKGFTRLRELLHHLVHSRTVAFDEGTVIELAVNNYAFLVRHVFDLLDSVKYCLFKIEVLVVESKLTLFELGQIEKIVDQIRDLFGRENCILQHQLYFF